jgi:hypothetical protein
VIRPIFPGFLTPDVVWSLFLGGFQASNAPFLDNPGLLSGLRLYRSEPESVAERDKMRGSIAGQNVVFGRIFRFARCFENDSRSRSSVTSSSKADA